MGCLDSGGLQRSTGAPSTSTVFQCCLVAPFPQRPAALGVAFHLISFKFVSARGSHWSVVPSWPGLHLHVDSLAHMLSLIATQHCTTGRAILAGINASAGLQGFASTCPAVRYSLLDLHRLIVFTSLDYGGFVFCAIRPLTTCKILARWSRSSSRFPIPRLQQAHELLVNIASPCSHDRRYTAVNQPYIPYT